MSPMLGAGNSEITQNAQTPHVQTPHYRPVGADRADRLSTSNDVDPTKVMTTTTTTSSTGADCNVDSINPSDPNPDSPASSSTKRQQHFTKDNENLDAYIRQKMDEPTEEAPNAGERRCTPMWPVIEAMSQDAVAELVDSFFANAGVGQAERMTYEQFFTLSQSDRSLLAWFEALGTVF